MSHSCDVMLKFSATLPMDARIFTQLEGLSLLNPLPSARSCQKLGAFARIGAVQPIGTPARVCRSH